MVYEIKFEIDEPQFTQREVLGVIDLPKTTIDTWIKRNLLEPFEFERDFGTESEKLDRLLSQTPTNTDKLRVYKIFQHDPALRRSRMYSMLDTLCLAGIKAVLDANVEIRFACQFPVLLCDWWTDKQLWNLGRLSISEEPIILYVDDGRLMSLKALIGKNGMLDLTRAMRDAQLSSVTVIDWPAVEERVIDGLKRIIGVRGHRSWETEKLRE